MVRTFTRKCSDCGAPCSKESLRCRSCWAKAWTGAKMRATVFCCDCHKKTAKGGKRCRQCQTKFMRERKPWESPAWKGGRYLEARGYIRVRSPGHPRADRRGYAYEHILVWEKYHHKSVPNGSVIHHLNGIKGDNRPENLVALTSRKHKFVLEAKAKRIQELEALLNHQRQLL